MSLVYLYFNRVNAEPKLASCDKEDNKITVINPKLDIYFTIILIKAITSFCNKYNIFILKSLIE